MSTVISKLDDNVCTLTINRPEQYNALNKNVLIELNSKLDAIIEENKCSAIIITGMGSKAFVAGANEKVKDRLAKFGVEGIIETRKEALETALNEIA